VNDLELQRFKITRTEELLKLFSSAIRSRTLYPENHPIVEYCCQSVADGLKPILQDYKSWTIVLLGGEFVFEKIPLTKLSMALKSLYRTVSNRGIDSITVREGVKSDEILGFINFMLDDENWKRSGDITMAMATSGIKNIAIQRVAVIVEGLAGSTDTDEARDIYSSIKKILTQYFLSLFFSKKTASIDQVRQVLDRLINNMEQNKFAVASRLHTRHASDDLVAHSINTAIISYVAAVATGVKAELLIDILLAGLFHDIGLMDIPPKSRDGILLKSNNKVIFFEHPVRGVGILRSIPGVSELTEIVAFEHHLRWDGKGFPQRGEHRKLNPVSCLISLASMYDRLLHGDEYVPIEAIPIRMIRLAGSEFEPQMLANFLSALGIYPPGTYVRLTSGDVALVVESNRSDVFRPKVKLIFDADNNEYVEDQVIDLTERDPVLGSCFASIATSISPDEIVL